jgi:hypothetical protein
MSAFTFCKQLTAGQTYYIWIKGDSNISIRHISVLFQKLS